MMHSGVTENIALNWVEMENKTLRADAGQMGESFDGNDNDELPIQNVADRVRKHFQLLHHLKCTTLDTEIAIWVTVYVCFEVTVSIMKMFAVLPNFEKPSS